MSGAEGTAASPTTTRLVLAFLAVYVIWGSTYLFIRWGVASMPPFVLAGIRFIVAAALMTAWARWQGAPWPDAADLRNGVATGVLMLSVGNGTVSWASQHAASGRLALVVALTPVWMVLLDWLRPGGKRPAWLEGTGILVGLVGVAMLIGPDLLAEHDGGLAAVAELVVMVGTMSWATGSLLSRHARGRTTPAMRTAVQMATAAVVLNAVALARGEWQGFEPSQVTLRSWLSLAYLVTFGSMVAFTAYVWLLKVVSPAKAATYAYVNPAVAVLLGWLFAGETFTPRMLTASAVIIAGVGLVTVARAVSWPVPRRGARG